MVFLSVSVEFKSRDASVKVTGTKMRCGDCGNPPTPPQYVFNGGKYYPIVIYGAFSHPIPTHTHPTYLTQSRAIETSFAKVATNFRNAHETFFVIARGSFSLFV